MHVPMCGQGSGQDLLPAAYLEKGPRLGHPSVRVPGGRTGPDAILDNPAVNLDKGVGGGVRSCNTVSMKHKDC